ncbi:PhoH family protein, partial [Streptomyces sp. BE20]|nr:PhoH family protein [Streptomyces sp. BE20]
TSGWTGMSELHVAADDVDALFSAGHDTAVSIECVSDLPVHSGLVLKYERVRELVRVTGDVRVRLVLGERDAFGMRGRSAEQRVALDLLLDPAVGIVSRGGRAGPGKSALARCAGLEAVRERP